MFANSLVMLVLVIIIATVVIVIENIVITLTGIIITDVETPRLGPVRIRHVRDKAL